MSGPAETETDEGMDRTLIRLQERSVAQGEKLDRLERMIETGNQKTSEALEKIATAFNKAFDKASSEYVTKAEFQSVKNIVNGAVALILVAFIGGLIALVFQK